MRQWCPHVSRGRQRRDIPLVETERLVVREQLEVGRVDCDQTVQALVGGWMGEWMDGCMDGWMDGSMGGGGRCDDMGVRGSEKMMHGKQTSEKQCVSVWGFEKT